MGAKFSKVSKKLNVLFLVKSSGCQWVYLTNFKLCVEKNCSWLQSNGAYLQNHPLTNTIHLTLKMTSVDDVETTINTAAVLF